MIDLQKYVDGLFRHRRLTPEVKDLKEEILSNMLAKRDDLIAQGLSAERATEKAKESLSEVDYLIDGNQLTDVSKYHLDVCRRYCSTVLFFGFFLCRFSLPVMRQPAISDFYALSFPAAFTFRRKIKKKMSLLFYRSQRVNTEEKSHGLFGVYFFL